MKPNRVWWMALAAGVGAAIATINWQNDDPDYWWHIANAAYVLAHHGFPIHSPWLFGMAANHVWTAAEWGSEMWMYFSGRAGTVWICVGLFILICVITGLRIRNLGTTNGIAAMLGAWGIALVSWGELAARDQLITTLGVAGLAWFCEWQERGGKIQRWMWGALILGSVAWANLHPGFVAGFGVWGVAILYWSWRKYRKHPVAVDLAANWRLIILSGLATLANPFTWKLWIYVITTLKGGGTQFVQEWQSPNFHWITFAPLLLFILVLPFVWTKVSAIAKIWIMVFVAATLVSGRNEELLAAVGVAPVIAAAAQRWNGVREPKVLWLAAGSILMLLALAQVGIAAVTPLSNNLQPVTLTTYMQQHYARGWHIFVDYGSAGYVLEHLPYDKVWLYGDNALTGATILREYNEIIDLQPGWERQLRQVQAGLAILNRQDPLTQALMLIPQCRVVRGDAHWIVIVPRGNSCPLGQPGVD